MVRPSAEEIAHGSHTVRPRSARNAARKRPASAASSLSHSGPSRQHSIRTKDSESPKKSTHSKSSPKHALQHFALDINQSPTQADSPSSVHTHKSNTPVSALLGIISSHRSASSTKKESRFWHYFDMLVLADERRYTKMNVEERAIPYTTAPILAVLLTLMLIFTLAIGDADGNRGFASTNENPMLGPSSLTLARFGGNVATLIKRNFTTEGWRLFAAGFLHAGIIHLLVNVMTLWVLCPKLDKWYGPTSVLILFVVTSTGSQFISSLVRTRNLVSVGSSGAICGMLGSILADNMKNWNAIHMPYTQLGYWTVQTLIFLAFGYIPFFDNVVHVGGLLMGLAYGFTFIPEIQIPLLPNTSTHFLGGRAVKYTTMAISGVFMLLVFVAGSVLFYYHVNISSQALCYAFLSLTC